MIMNNKKKEISNPDFQQDIVQEKQRKLVAWKSKNHKEQQRENEI